mgnify:CR=1 FL=1
MYKKFFMGIAAMAALTLVSCSSDDLNSLSDNSSKNEAISFDGYLGRSTVAVNGTRGSVETKKTLIGEGKGFGVFGYYNSSATDHNSTPDQSFNANLFTNEHVTCLSEGANWTYSPLKFWPTQGHIDFLAYAPYDGTNTTLTGTSINFEVSKTIANQKDLLWANAENKTKDNISSTGNKVKFHFYHALSRLGYTVKLFENKTYNNVTFTLNKITLAGSSDGTSKNAFYTKGTIDLSKAPGSGDLWNTSSSSTNEAKQNFPWVSSDKQVDNTGIKNAETDYLFVIPQDFSQDKTEEHDVDELYVIVEYTISYGDGTTQPVKNTVYKQIKKKFLQGKAYTLNLTIGLPIEFDVEVVEDWKAPEDGTGDINIGSNDTPWER